MISGNVEEPPDDREVRVLVAGWPTGAGVGRVDGQPVLAFNRDLKVVVVGDAVASMYGDDLHLFGLENVARCLGWVVAADQLVERLAGTTKTAGMHRVRETSHLESPGRVPSPGCLGAKERALRGETWGGA